ncbi:MAG TPA: MFS transporter [Candidatus Dormibacteraeota bacterium]
MLAPLRLRDFRLLWTGQLLSNLGSWLLVVAVPYRVFEQTGSAAATALAFVAASAPSLVLAPFAGMLVDRWDRRRTMLCVDLGRAAAILPLLGAHDLWVVYAVLLAESVLGQLFDPAAQSLVPTLVGRGPELAAANGLLWVIEAVGRLGGAALGGLVVAAWGLGTAVALDAGTYLASALTLLLITPPGRSDPARTSGHPGAELHRGIRHLVAGRDLRGLFVLTVVFRAANGALTALLVPYVALRLHGSAGALGLLLAATGAGFLLGAPMAREAARRWGLRATTAWSLVATGVGFLAWFNTGRLAAALALAACTGAAAVVFLATRTTHLQVLTPDRLLGRVSAGFLAAGAAATLAGTALGGGAAGVAGLAPVASAAGLALAGAGALALLLLTGDPDPRRAAR